MKTVLVKNDEHFLLFETNKHNISPTEMRDEEDSNFKLSHLNENKAFLYLKRNSVQIHFLIGMKSKELSVIPLKQNIECR